MEVPRIKKVVVNIGLGEALDNAKALDAAVGDLNLITGQKPVSRKPAKALQILSFAKVEQLAQKSLCAANECGLFWIA